MRFSFGAEGEDRQPILAVDDSPITAPRAWHGPLTAAQCQQFVDFGWTIVPSVLSAAECCEPAGPPSAGALTKRLQVPLQSCKRAMRAKRPGSNIACEIWLALDGDAMFEIGLESVVARDGDVLFLNADVCDNSDGSGSQRLRQMLERAGLKLAQQPLQQLRL